jgi:hypothetical protein
MHYVGQGQGQTEREGVELLCGELQCRRRGPNSTTAIKPDEPPGVKPARGAPHAEAIVYE